MFSHPKGDACVWTLCSLSGSSHTLDGEGLVGAPLLGLPVPGRRPSSGKGLWTPAHSFLEVAPSPCWSTRHGIAPLAVLGLPLPIHAPQHHLPLLLPLPEASSVRSPLTCGPRAGAREFMPPPPPAAAEASGVSAGRGPSSMPGAGKTASRGSPARPSRLLKALTFWVTCLPGLPPLSVSLLTGVSWGQLPRASV